MAKYRYEFYDRTIEDKSSNLVLVLDTNIMTKEKMLNHLMSFPYGAHLTKITSGSIQDGFMSLLADYLFQSMQRNHFRFELNKLVASEKWFGFVLDGYKGILLERLKIYDHEPVLSNKELIQEH